MSHTIINIVKPTGRLNHMVPRAAAWNMISGRKDKLHYSRYCSHSLQHKTETTLTKWALERTVMDFFMDRPRNLKATDRPFGDYEIRMMSVRQGNLVGGQILRVASYNQRIISLISS